MSVDYSLELCYGVIVPDEVVEEFIQISEEFDDFRDTFALFVNLEESGKNVFI